MSNINMGGQSVYTKTQGIKFADGTEQDTAAIPIPQGSIIVFSYKVFGLTSASYPLNVVTYTVPVTGFYRISGLLYPTALSSCEWTVQAMYATSQTAEAGTETVKLTSAELAAGRLAIAPVGGVLVWLTANTVIKLQTVTLSGSNTGAAFNLGFVVEQMPLPS